MIERIPSHPPEIKAVPDQIKRPLWSVMIPSYNCSQYLVESIRSVLEQDPGAEYMQIEVVDDFSTDTDVESLVKDIGKGRVSFYRQPRNVGSLRNFETCLNRATGHYIHLLHGDDQVLPGFYTEIEKVFSSFPEAGAAFTGYFYIDKESRPFSDNKELLSAPGLLNNWLLTIAREQLIQTPAMVVKRTVYEKLGGFFAVHYGEDWEMWVRIAAHYPVAHSPERLALYRVHQNNITNRYFLSGQNIKDSIKVIDIIQNYLPPGERTKIRKFQTRQLAHYFSEMSDLVYHEYGNPQAALEQSKMAMAMHFSLNTFMQWIKIHIKILIGYKSKKIRNGFSGQ